MNDIRRDNSRHIRARRGSEIKAQELDHRGRGSDADEQSRRRGRRGPAEPGRLWRHRPRSAQLGMLRQDRRDARAAGGGPDPARPVGQAGRRVPHAQGRAARAHRQLQPRAQMGELGGVQRARSQGPDDVRPDDRRQLDLHRHAGHRPRHLRDLRRDGPPALWRRPQGPLDPDRGPRRNGRRAAARRGDGRRALHRDRGARKAGSRSGSRRATSTGARPASTRRSRSSAPRPSRPASACSAMPPRSCRRCCERGIRPDALTDQTSRARSRQRLLPGRLERREVAGDARARSRRGRRSRAASRSRAMSRRCSPIAEMGVPDLRLRQQHPPGSQGRWASPTPSTSPASSRPMSGRCSAAGSGRSAGRRCSGDPEDIYRTDANA